MGSRKKMSPMERAKQFMPFNALSGLEEALRQKEREALKVPRPILSEERQGEIDFGLRKIMDRGVAKARATFFDSGEILAVSGEAACNGSSLRVDNTDIPFKNLLFLEIEGEES